MLPVERKNRIKELIQTKQHIKISELSKMLGVSEMTIHRDLKPLIDDQVVMKTFGGITVGPESPKQTSHPEICVLCSRGIDERMAYRLILPNNKIDMACCAHCGLIRHHQIENDVVQALCHDFLRQTTISAPLAWYVMDTSIHIGCCQPQVLTFEWEEHAEKFVKGFGGNIYPFHEAITRVLGRKNRKDHEDCSHPEST